MLEIKVKKLRPDAIMPVRGSEEAACFDVCAVEGHKIEFPLVVPVGTGLAFQVPKGNFIDIRPRSGLSRILRIANSPGTLDSDYRGELIIMLQCTSPQVSYLVGKGDRIAQIRLCRLPNYSFEEVDELETTKRGKKGFGSSGI
jgi:dUTP pyrophosphatase